MGSNIIFKKVQSQKICRDILLGGMGVKFSLKKLADQLNKMIFWAHSKSDTAQIKCLEMHWDYLHAI